MEESTLPLWYDSIFEPLKYPDHLYVCCKCNSGIYENEYYYSFGNIYICDECFKYASPDIAWH